MARMLDGFVWDGFVWDDFTLDAMLLDDRRRMVEGFESLCPLCGLEYHGNESPYAMIGQKFGNG